MLSLFELGFLIVCAGMYMTKQPAVYGQVIEEVILRLLVFELIPQSIVPVLNETYNVPILTIYQVRLVEFFLVCITSVRWAQTD